jgi:hypothetical protein
MATRATTIPVDVYLVPPSVPGQPLPKSELMRPTPLAEFVGRYARRKELKEIWEKVASSPLVADKGHKVTAVNWGERPDRNPIAVVTVMQGEAGPQPPARPIAPPVQTRRTAIARRHAGRPKKMS